MPGKFSMWKSDPRLTLVVQMAGDSALELPRTAFVVQVLRRSRPTDVAFRSTRHQQPVGNLRMVTPRAESSPSNCVAPGEGSRSPGTITAHSRFSRNSFD